MQLLERVRKTEFIGREFLLWLWFKSDVNECRFSLGEDGLVELWFDKKIVLESDSEEGTEKVICSGENPHLKEARFALTKFKSITEATVVLKIGDNEWSFGLDSMWLNFKSLKTPKVMQDTKEDPDGLFYEKFYLIEKAVSAIDSIFASFIEIRTSAEWETEELPALREWVQKGK